MPITQYRFLEVLDAAAAVLKLQQSIIPFARDIKQGQDRLDAALNHYILDEETTRALAANRAYVNTLAEILMQANINQQELFGIIHAEKKYFDRHGRANNKAAERQRRQREKRKGHLPAILSDEQGPSPDHPEPVYDEETLRKWQSGGKASETSPMLRHLSGEPSVPAVAIAEEPKPKPSDNPGGPDIGANTTSPDPEVIPDEDTIGKDIL